MAREKFVRESDGYRDLVATAAAEIRTVFQNEFGEEIELVAEQIAEQIAEPIAQQRVDWSIAKKAAQLMACEVAQSLIQKFKEEKIS